MDNDVVILCAGKNERLKGIVPSYYKPLMLVDGQPLIKRIVENSLLLTESPILIAAPENVKAICEVLGNELCNKCKILIQPSATGLVNALSIAFSVITKNRIAIICSDNIIPQTDFELIKNSKDQLMFGKLIQSDEEAFRFTRMLEDRSFIEHHSSKPLNAGGHKCWIGPLCVSKESYIKLIEDNNNISDEFIGNKLNHCGRFDFVFSTCRDIGVPESL